MNRSEKRISMILYDTHMHTEFSTDSDTPVTAQTERAEQAGLRGICITDHMDYDFPAELCDETFTGDIVTDFRYKSRI